MLGRGSESERLRFDLVVARRAECPRRLLGRGGARLGARAPHRFIIKPPALRDCAPGDDLCERRLWNGGPNGWTPLFSRRKTVSSASSLALRI